MSWQQLTTNWPSSAANQAGQVGATLEMTAGHDAAGTSRLAAIASRAQYRRHSLGPAADGLLAMRQQLDALLVQAQILAVTPYQFGVGLPEEGNHYLAPTNAAKALATKLTDLADPHRPTGTVHAVGLMVCATSASQLISLLTTTTAVLPIPEWCAALRRLSADNQRMTRPAAAAVPRWQPASPLALDPLRGFRAAQGGQLAQIEALAADSTTPLDRLQAIAARRADRLASLAAALAAMAANSANLWVWQGGGEPGVIAGQLTAATPADYGHVFSVGALVVSPSPLTFLQELLS